MRNKFFLKSLFAVFILLLSTGCSSKKYNFDGVYKLKGVYLEESGSEYIHDASEIDLSGSLTMQGENYTFKLVNTKNNATDTFNGKYKVIDEDDIAVVLSLPEFDGIVVFSKSNPPTIHLSAPKYDPIRLTYEK